MSEDEFTRLFKYMSERFDAVDTAVATKASSEDMQCLLKKGVVLTA